MKHGFSRSQAPPGNALLSRLRLTCQSMYHRKDSRGRALMAIASPNTSTATTATVPGAGQSYGAPLATVTTLFFMWGFLTCLNDILVPHLKSIFDLSYAQVMLIQFAFFGAYFIFSIPSAKIIDWIGYQRSMVVGLLTM